MQGFFGHAKGNPLIANGAFAMTVQHAGKSVLRVDHQDRRILQMQHHRNHADETREVMKRVADSLAAGGVDVIELDLGAMRMITSQTLNELITLNTRAKSCGVRLVLTNLADNLRDIFVITRLERMFELA